MQKELQLEDLLKILKKGFVFIVILSLICAVIGFALSNYVLKKKYESSALVYVENGQGYSESLNLNDISVAQKLVNTCQVIFKSNTMFDKLIESLGLPYSRGELNSMITAVSVNSTEVMKITVSSNDPNEAALIVNTMLGFANEEFYRVIKSGSLEIVDYGTVNLRQTYPNITIFTAAGFLIGFVIAYLIAFFKETFDVVVKHDDDLAKLYNIPIFAEIPDQDSKNLGEKYKYSYSYAYGFDSKSNVSKKKHSEEVETALSRKDHMLTDATPFSIVEAYNSGRTNILFSVAPYKNKIIVFTSSNPRECKSTSCLNTSISFAKAGYKTLIIDCDMRKPVLNKYFNISDEKGLSSVLSGFCSVEEALTRNVADNLDAITVGAIPPNPSELLGSAAMTKLLEIMTQEYDYVFLDTPPVNVVTDSQLMNNMVAGIVLIIRESATTHPDVAEAINRIELASGRTLGIIKTCCSTHTKRYGKKKTDSYYSYSYYGY